MSTVHYLDLLKTRCSETEYGQTKSQRVQQSKIPSSPSHLKTKKGLVSKMFLINLNDAQSPKHQPSS